MTVKYDEYKGSKVIVLTDGSNEIMFGKNKAQMIVKYYNEIKKFAENG